MASRSSPAAQGADSLAAPEAAPSAARRIGPWQPIGFILEGEDWEPGEVAFILKTDGRGVSIDDLRLAAAAPDLHAALALFLAEYVELVESGDAGYWDPEQENKVKLARAALAKAEGRQ